MSTHTTDKPGAIVPFAPISKGQPDANIMADDSGRAILALSALRPCIWCINFRRSFEQRKKGYASLRQRQHIFATARRAQKNGCSSIMRLNKHSGLEGGRDVLKFCVAQRNRPS